MAGAKVAWKAFGGLSAVAAALLARKVGEQTWKRAFGRQPPKKPESPDTTWYEAVGWVVASGALIGIMRVFAARKAANYWKRSTGRLPPGLEAT